MLKTILCALFIIVGKTQENQQPIADGNSTMPLLLNDTKAVPIQLSKHLSHNRKLLNVTTTAGPNITTTLGPNITTTANPNTTTTTTPSPTSKPTYHSEKQWHTIWAGVGAASVFCLAGTLCVTRYTCKKCAKS